MRIAIDIDSHAAPLLGRPVATPPSAASASTCPTRSSSTWGITRLKPRAARSACIEDTHGDAAILAATPYPGRGRDGQRAGTRPATSSTSRATAPCRAARRDRALAAARSACPTTSSTARTTRSRAAREIGIDVLIDDSPVNSARAVDAGIVGGDDRATRGTATSARRRTSSAPPTGPSCGAGWRLSWSLRTTRPERRAQLFPPVRHEPVPASLHAHQFPRRGRYRLPFPPSLRH